jgi:hypothetical protein
LVSNTGRLKVGFTHRPYWLQAGVTYCGNCRITRMRRMMFSERLRLCVADSSHSRHSCDSAGPGVRSPTTRHRRIVRRVTKKAVVAVTTASSQQCHHIRSYQSGRPDSNRRRPAWEAGILPTELRPRSDIVESHRSGLNRRPLDYESSALPLSYSGDVPDHALARIRTATPFGTTPSRWRVYQFHHQGTENCTAVGSSVGQ